MSDYDFSFTDSGTYQDEWRLEDERWHEHADARYERWLDRLDLALVDEGVRVEVRQAA